MNRDQILHSIRELPTHEQLDLIQEVWNALVADGTPIGLSPSQVSEYEQRIRRHAANPDEAIEWADVIGRIPE